MKNQKIEALRMFLNYESVEDITESYDENTFDTPDGEYMVLTDEEADEKAKESVESFIDECGITSFTPSFQQEIINNCADLSWFDEAMRESYEFYIEDIREEIENEDEEGNEVTRLQQEMKDADCEDEESFLDYLCSDDAQQWYKDNFGEEAYNTAITENCSLDTDKICETAINWDGRGHFLASYDNEENEQLLNDTWFYIYRTN